MDWLLDLLPTWSRLKAAIVDFAPLALVPCAELLAAQVLAAGTAEAFLWDLLYNPDQPRDERGRFAKDGDYRVHPETKKVVHKDEVEKWKKEQEKKEKGKKGKEKPAKVAKEKPAKEKPPAKSKYYFKQPANKDELINTLKNDPVIQKQVAAIQAIGKPERERYASAHKTWQDSETKMDDLCKQRDAATGVKRGRLDIEISKLNHERQGLFKELTDSGREYHRGLDANRQKMMEVLKPPVKERHDQLSIIGKNAQGEINSRTGRVEVTAEQKQKVNDLTTKAGEFYQATLAKKSNDGDLHTTTLALDKEGHSEGRAYQSSGELGLHHTDDVATAVHEWGHFVEHRVDGAKKASYAFIDHRIGNEVPISLKDKFGRNYGAHEFGRKDNFEKAFSSPDALPSEAEHHAYYAGKKYAHNSTEIISMGMEHFYKDPGGFASRDPEYASFIVGILNGRGRVI